MAEETSSARTLARRLIAPDERHAPERAVPALVAACERVHEELARWVGGVGAGALFTRAVAQERARHPALASMRVRSGSAPGLDDVAESVSQFGTDAVASALEALLIALLALLGRLIGDDMVEQLIGRAMATPPKPEAAPASPDDPSDS